MIEFVMVEPKEELPATYVEELISNININQFINAEIYDASDNQWKVKIEIDNEKHDLYFIEVAMQTYNSYKHLFFKITPQYIKREFDKELHDLKLHIKDQIRNQWIACIWLRDEQSNNFAQELYVNIHRMENWLRRLINIIMVRTFGVAWWQKYTGIKLRNKYNARYTSYKRIAPGYKNVSDQLFSIDTDDLLEIMTHKVKRFPPNKNQIVLNALQAINSEGDFIAVANEYKKVVDKLREECEVEMDLWTDVYKSYFPDDFIENWEEFCKNRHHVAHNKLIDLIAFKKIYKNIETVSNSLKIAEENLEEKSISDENKELLLLEMEELTKIGQFETMEEEAGVKILDNSKIFELLKEEVNKYLYNLSDELYFREDLVTHIEEVNEEFVEKEVFSLKSKIIKNQISLTATINVNDGMGEESTAELKLILNNELIETFYILYINGRAEFNEEQGYFMPITKDELNDKGLRDLANMISSLLEEHLPNLIEKVNSEAAAIVRDGGTSPVAESECGECGEPYICIDEEIAEIGLCVACGHMNELKECIRCQKLFNPSTEGESELCDSCTVYFNEYF